MPVCPGCQCLPQQQLTSKCINQTAIALFFVVEKVQIWPTPYLNSFHSHVFNGLHGWWKPSFVILHFQFKFYILNLELVSFVVILQSFDYFLRVSTKWGSGNDQMMIRWWPDGDQFHENDDSHLCLSRVNLSILYSKRLPGLAKQHRYRPGFKSFCQSLEFRVVLCV